MTAAVGRSLELYYIDGRPDGMLTAELFNWTGHVLMAPRTQIAAALRRPEAGYAGIYLLLGEQDGGPRAYVGEGEDIAARIRAHDGAKDWWTSAVLVTTAGNKLNKAHVRYLEARLIEEARSIGRMLLDNGTNPARPTLSEADVAKMEAFLDNLLIVLPAVRVDMFISRTRPATPVLPTPATSIRSQSVLPTEFAAPVRFIMEIKKRNIKATAVLQGGELVVEAGSLASEPYGASSYAAVHAELVQVGTLVRNGEQYRFTRNYAFRSPSAAAAAVTGRSANGTIEWKEIGTGMTYKDWEARQLAATSTDAA